MIVDIYETFLLHSPTPVTNFAFLNYKIRMASAFIYDKYVTGKNFIGRRMDSIVLSNLLEAGENVYIYGPPESGKMSLVQQTLFNMRGASRQFMVGQVDLFNVRSSNEFVIKFGSAVIQSCASAPHEYAELVAKYLSGTHFVFDPMRFTTAGEVVSLNWDMDKDDIAAMLTLPMRISQDKSIPYYMVISEFQNLMSADDFEDVFKVMEEVMTLKAKDNRSCFILMGSQVNAMKFIFEEKRWFWRLINQVSLHNVEDKDIIEHVVKGFASGGKVIERELILGACKLFKSDMWRINHFFSICDSMSKGYINETILMDALRAMIALNEPHFKWIINDLTDHQLSLVRAAIDGVTKFSASDVIEKYSLNSSANVRRVKDALKKKEVLTFNEKDEPVFLDPLLEYWLNKYYFEIH